MEEKEYGEQINRVSIHFFKLLNIPITSNTLTEQLLSHPDYPSLASLSDVCKYYNIDHVALENQSLEQLEDNGFPAIVLIQDPKQTLVVVEDIHNDKIKYYHPVKNKIYEPLNEFRERWSGIVFYALPEDESGEENFKLKKAEESLLKLRSSFLLITCILLIGYTIFLQKPLFNLQFVSLLLVKIVGLFFSIQLVIHSFGLSTSITDKVCQAGKQVSCEDVLESPASKLLGLFSMSDIGFVYFSTGILLMIFSIYLKTILPTTTFLLLITLCAIPYVLFSIYYQAFKVKKWCPLCLSVMGVLIAESILFVLNQSYLDFHIFRFDIIGIVVLCFIITACSWSYIKQLIISAERGKEYEYKYFRLKKNPQIYNAQLNASPSFEMDFSSSDLIIGTPDAELAITCVVNTNCGPCAMAHLKLEKILAENAGHVKMIIRFMLTEEEVALHLISLYLEKGAEIFENALHDWFDHKNYELLRKEYPVNKVDERAIQMINEQRAWCNRLHIHKTPEIFIGDKKIGNEYTVDDIQWLISNIINN